MLLESKSNPDVSILFTRWRTMMFSTVVVATVSINIWDSALNPHHWSRTLESFLCLDALPYKLSSVRLLLTLYMATCQVQPWWKLCGLHCGSVHVSLGGYSDVNNSLSPCPKIILLAPMQSPSVVLYSWFWVWEVNRGKKLIEKTKE